MKKYVKVSLFTLLVVLVGCSSTRHTDKRGVASSEFQCKFEEVIDGEKAEFAFSPDSLKLSITTAKTGVEVVDLSEDNFISGGFTYVQDPKRKVNDWDLKKLEFVSFTATPNVKLDFKRTPASKAMVLAKNCTF